MRDFAPVDRAREEVREFLDASGFASRSAMTFAVESDVPTFGRLLFAVGVFAGFLVERVFARPPRFVIVLLHVLHEFAFVSFHFLLR